MGARGEAPAAERASRVAAAGEIEYSEMNKMLTKSKSAAAAAEKAKPSLKDAGKKVLNAGAVGRLTRSGSAASAKAGDAAGPPA